MKYRALLCLVHVKKYRVLKAKGLSKKYSKIPAPKERRRAVCKEVDERTGSLESQTNDRQDRQGAVSWRPA
jgi:hypothetical protein